MFLEIGPVSMTSNYLSIFLQGNDDLKNKIVDAKIEKINNNNSLFGTILGNVPN